MEFDGNTALPLELVVVEDLLTHLTLVERARPFEESIGALVRAINAVPAGNLAASSPIAARWPEVIGWSGSALGIGHGAR